MNQSQITPDEKPDGSSPEPASTSNLPDIASPYLRLPSLLLEAQIPTLEIFADEPKTVDLARWLKGWGITVESVDAPEGLSAEWIPTARPLRLGERYSYGELLTIWTPAQAMAQPPASLDQVELALIKQGRDKVQAIGQLRLTPQLGAPGLAPVTLRLRGEGGPELRIVTILVRVITLPRAEFTFKPAKPIKRATVAGTFNGWNKNALELTDADGDGVYTASMRAKPGRYEYKFVVDDAWVPDPANPRHSADGFQNSILELDGAEATQPLDLITIPSAHKEYWTFAVLGGGVDAVAAWRGNDPISGEFKEFGAGVIGIPRPAKEQTPLDIRVVVRSEAGAWSELMLPREEQQPPAPPALTGHHLIYYAMTDRFFDGNMANTAKIDDPELTPLTNFHGGDFAGITQKLREGYFDSLGVTAIWLSSPNQNTPKAEYDSLPPHRKFSAYHGYWPISPNETDPHFGTMDELRELCAEARRRGIIVIFDFVSNHTHVDHPYYSQHPEWFGQLELSDGRKNIRLFDEHPLTTWFDTFLPSFNFPGSPEAIEQVTADAVWWLRETGAGGFRHDATKHVPYDFWMRLSERLWEDLEAPSGRRVFQVGETISDRELIMSFVGPEMMSGQFDFPLFWRVRDAFAFQNIPMSDLAYEMHQSALIYGKKARMSPFAGNHDFSRFMAFATGAVTPETTQQEKEVGWTHPPTVENPGDYGKLRLALGFVMTQPGAPLIYYGDEFGMTGAGDPDNRRPMRFGRDLTPEERANLEFTRKLTGIRRSVSALWRGDTYTVLADADVLVYLRTDTHSVALVALNRSQRPQRLDLTLPSPFKDSGWHSLMTGSLIECRDGKIELTIPPQGLDILRIK